MPFITIDEVKDYLELDHTDDDTMLNRWLTRVEFKFQSYVERAIECPGAEDDPFVEYFDGGKTHFQLRNWPVKEDSITITDTDDDSNPDEDDYVIYPEFGRITRKDVSRYRDHWPKGLRRWKVEYKGGMDQDRYWEFVEEDIRGSFLDVIADWYENRNPNATSEREGGGMGVSFDNLAIPNRVKLVWDDYARIDF